MADYSVESQLELGLIGNGPDDIVGNFDLNRAQGVIDKMVAAGMEVAETDANNLVTNEFIDNNIGL